MLVACGFLCARIVVDSVINFLPTNLPSLPLARNAAYSTVDYMVFRFGGWNDTHRFINDLVRIDSQKWQWDILKAEGDVPTGRYGATLNSLGKRYLVLIGGLTRRGLSNEVHIFNIEENFWILGVQASKYRMPARMFHSTSTSGQGTLYISGGLGSNANSLSDVWLADLQSSNGFPQFDTFVYSTSQFLQLPELPSLCLVKHSTQFVENRLYFLGDQDTETPPVDCTVNFIDLSTSKYVRMPTRNCAPVTKGAATLALGRRLLMAAGCWTNRVNGTICHRDVWGLDLQELQAGWTKIAGSESLGMRMDFSLSRNGATSLIAVGGHYGKEQAESKALLEIVPVLTARLDSGCTGGCVYSGTCVNDRCHCIEGFSEGFDCSLKSFVSQPTAVNICSNQGILQDTGNCDCYLGYYGTRCQYGQRACLNNCTSHGECDAKSRCVCYDGFTGLDCSEILKCPHSCCDRGICLPDATCSCSSGYYGPTCLLNRSLIETAKDAARSYIANLDLLKKQWTVGDKANQEGAAEFIQTIEATYDRSEKVLLGDVDVLEDYFESNSRCQPSLLPLTLPTPAEIQSTKKDYAVLYHEIDVALQGVHNSGQTSSEQLGFNVSGWWQKQLARQMQLQEAIDKLQGIDHIRNVISKEEKQRQEASIEEAREELITNFSMPTLSPRRRQILRITSILLGFGTTYKFVTIVRRKRYGRTDNEHTPLLI